MSAYDRLTASVTRRLIDLIEAPIDDGQTWSLPWHRLDMTEHLRARNPTTSQPYRGANLFKLAIAGFDAGYPTGEWATYKQWRADGGQVRKGEQATQIVKWVERRTKPDPSANGVTKPSDGESEDGRRVLIPKVYSVFNLHQVDHPDGPPAQPPIGGIVEADRWIAAAGAKVVHGGDSAYFSLSADTIYLPERQQFSSIEAYYGVSLHEHVHWTGHPKRLSRNIGRHFGSDAYATEELVAELGAAIGCARLGVTNEPRPDHARYLAHWVDLLDAEPKVLWQAASAA